MAFKQARQALKQLMKVIIYGKMDVRLRGGKNELQKCRRPLNHLVPGL